MKSRYPLFSSIHLGLFLFVSTTSIMSCLCLASTAKQQPIVYTIAGSDSGGGAGIQADLHAMANFGCHGCSAITCLTAQNSVGVTAVHTPPASFLREQLNALVTDLPPVAIKIGMLGSKELAEQVGGFLKELRATSQWKVWVILDPVMISTSGSRLLDEDAQQSLIDEVFPYCDILTPNKYEAEALLDGRKLSTAQDVEQAALDLLKLGVPAVLIKGGHSTDNKGGSVASDYFLAATTDAVAKASSSSSNTVESRLCDGGVWLQSPRYNTIHTHGTGCTLSSCMAAAMALGEHSRRRLEDTSNEQRGGGAYSALNLVDAVCLAKAYVTSGIFHGRQLGQGPGPVGQTVFPERAEFFPSIPFADGLPFLAMRKAQQQEVTSAQSNSAGDCPVLGKILPIVNSVDWVKRLCDATSKGACIQDIQLRIKGESDRERILEIVQESQKLCQAANIRLWINDFWEAALEAQCFGVHVGQEDLFKCAKAGGLTRLQKHGIALGISTHSFSELAAAIGIKPSYISLGPVFATGSKKVAFEPQGLDTVRTWRQLVESDVPLVAIGGIGNVESAKQVRDAGAECVAVIGAVTSSTKVEDIVSSVLDLNDAMSS